MIDGGHLSRHRKSGLAFSREKGFLLRSETTCFLGRWLYGIYHAGQEGKHIRVQHHARMNVHN